MDYKNYWELDTIKIVVKEDRLLTVRMTMVVTTIIVAAQDIKREVKEYEILNKFKLSVVLK